jgi:ankyrin repeat protein
LNPRVANRDLATTCLGYLSHSSTDDHVSEFYRAAAYWMYYVDAASVNPDAEKAITDAASGELQLPSAEAINLLLPLESELEKAIKDFLNPENSAYTAWRTAYEVAHKVGDDLPLAIFAAFTGSATVVRLLLEEDPGLINISGGEYGSLLEAAARGSRPCSIMYLLITNYNAEVNVASNGKYRFPLQAAARGGSLDAVKLLVNLWGADINASGGEHGSALQAAAVMGHEAIVRFLLDKKAEVNSRGGHFGSALQAAAWRESVSLVGLLLQNGADIDASDGEYGTALQIAVRERAMNVVELLLKHSPAPNINVYSEKHGTPLQLAVLQKSDSLVDLLRKHGAARMLMCAAVVSVTHSTLLRRRDSNLLRTHWLTLIISQTSTELEESTERPYRLLLLLLHGGPKNRRSSSFWRLELISTQTTETMALLSKLPYETMRRMLSNFFSSIPQPPI